METYTAKACGWTSKQPTYSHQCLLPVVAPLGRSFNPTGVLDVGAANATALPMWL